eukprot:TRINITY_DN1000_c0_g1_i2.p1 TRINITY_DN1000_c0_g1~~TRINITY_DN1000_c0_g1_i2.p1  ORF type:complete len:230 (+),score=41.39 TRINITY_DN1000_c0_g1_i2:358-1047(+)
MKEISLGTPQPLSYASENYETCETLLVIIQASGVLSTLKPGIWSRSLCISDGLFVGSMLPYLKRAQEEGYGIIIANPKYSNESSEDKSQQTVNPEKNMAYLWEKVLSKSKAKNIVIIAHSLAGDWIKNFLENTDEALERITAIAFIDSRHVISPEEKKNARLMEFFQTKARNWVKSSTPLGTEVVDLYTPYIGCPCVSSGQLQHAYAPSASMENVFKFIRERCQQINKE